MSNGWIGVDLDGTLAVHDVWQGFEHIGEPIPAMVNRVKQWLAEGITVKIVTARAANTSELREIAIPVIEQWCLTHIGQVLEITAEKDYGMIELWDDRAVTVLANTGVPWYDAPITAIGREREIRNGALS